jgi:hypothetical protein
LNSLTNKEGVIVTINKNLKKLKKYIIKTYLQVLENDQDIIKSNDSLTTGGQKYKRRQHRKNTAKTPGITPGIPKTATISKRIQKVVAKRKTVPKTPPRQKKTTAKN